MTLGLYVHPLNQFHSSIPRLLPSTVGIPRWAPATLGAEAVEEEGVAGATGRHLLRTMELVPSLFPHGQPVSCLQVRQCCGRIVSYDNPTDTTPPAYTTNSCSGARAGWWLG